MNIEEYMGAVIALFKSGRATDEHYREMAKSVLWMAEEHDSVPAIDAAIGVNDEEMG